MSNTVNVTKTDLPSYQISNEISNEIEATVPAPFEEETEQFIPTVTILFIRLTIFITIILYITILASSYGWQALSLWIYKWFIFFYQYHNMTI